MKNSNLCRYGSIERSCLDFGRYRHGRGGCGSSIHHVEAVFRTAKPLSTSESGQKRKGRNTVPLQLQAFERLILYLERINPEEDLCFVVNKPGMSARQFQAEVLKIIRDEFDHNLAQQLYVSTEAWESVKAAPRRETINILNVAAERVHKDADSMAFSQSILEVAGKLEKLPTDIAIRILKKEFRARVGS